ncbi:MAG TPA: hypothetical protein DF715_05835, partial [Oceanicaulis sp.]|nr:hypothetical protein [Oceanicaulis sp.]
MEPAFDPDNVQGFLAREEGEALARHVRALAVQGPVLEIGSWCGRSSVWLGQAAWESGRIV